MRRVSFDRDTGDIVVEDAELGSHKIEVGIVLLSTEMLDQARLYGWSPDGGTPEELKAGLIRVRREYADQTKRRYAIKHANDNRPEFRSRF